MISPRLSIGILSDTHSLIDPVWPQAFAGVSHLLHAGDVGDESMLEALGEIAPVTAVRGNIDGGPLRFLPESVVVELGGKQLGLLHIAGAHKRPNAKARALLLRHDLDLLIVGHTHIPVLARIGRTLWLNPGAAGQEGHHTERLAVLLHIELLTGEMSLERLQLGPRVQSGRG